MYGLAGMLVGLYLLRRVPLTAPDPHRSPHVTNFALPAIDPASVVRTRLSNGLTVLIRRDRSAPVVAIVTYVSAGYFDETDDVVGIAHVLEHMYFKGTPTRGVGEIAKQTKAVGGYLNAGDDLRSHELLHGAAVVGLRRRARRAGRRLRALADRRRRAGARARGHHPGSEAQGGQSAGAVATETLYELLHDRHRIRRWRIGREPGLRALDARRARGLLSQLLSSGQHGSLDRRRRRSRRGARARCRRSTARCRRASRTRQHGPDRRRRLRLPLSRMDAATSGRRSSRSAGARRARRTPTRRRSTCSPRCSAAAARRASIAPCASGGSRRRSRRTTTRRRRSACSSCTPRRRRSTTADAARADRGISCARCATATSASSRSSARSGSTNRSGCAGSRTWKGRRTISPSGKRWATGAWASGISSVCWRRRATISSPSRNRYLDPNNAGVVVYRPESSASPVARSADAMRDAARRRAAPEPLAGAGCRTPRTRCRRRRTPAFEREEAGVRVYRTANGVPIARAPQAGRAARARRRVHARRRERGAADARRPHDADGAHGAQGHDDAQRAADRRRRRAARRQRRAAAAGSESFGWSISVPARHAAAAIELLADVAQHPTFDDEALDTERVDRARRRRRAARRHVSLSDASRDAGGVRRASVRHAGERH